MRSQPSLPLREAIPPPNLLIDIYVYKVVILLFMWIWLGWLKQGWLRQYHPCANG
jgi:hypothetical protein